VFRQARRAAQAVRADGGRDRVAPRPAVTIRRAPLPFSGGGVNQKASPCFTPDAPGNASAMNRKPTLLLALLLPLSARAAAKPLPPNEAAARMTLPEGFRATLFAGEPDLVQPIAFTFDDRGRLWVAECRSYPKWLPDGQAGTDRILIFEDTDGDGRFDKRTVFADGLSNVTGLEYGFGGIWVCSAPPLI